MARTKVDRRILKTERSIICSMLKLQRNAEPDAISVTNLTNVADINRKTFYLHYRSVRAVSESVLSHIKDRLQEAIEAAADPETGISASAFFRHCQELIELYPDIFQNLFHKNVFPYYLLPIQSHIIDNLESLLARTHSCSEQDLRARIIYVIAGSVSLWMDRIARNDESDLSELTGRMAAFATWLFEDCR